MLPEHDPAAEPAAQTFLFADLAGFTAMTEAHGDEHAAELVSRFCDQARGLLPEYAAEEVKAIGDALMIRVPHAADAIRLSLRLTNEVGGQHGFPGVRVGLHTGPAVERDRDWFGATVNIAARVSTAATAGDVLATEATRDAAARVAPELEFQARGAQLFKNVSEPVELFSVGSRGQLALEQLAIDPVCQMAVDPERAAARRERSGQEFAFCSKACAETFDQAEGRFLATRGDAADLRASDRARDRATTLLATAYKRGRLSVEELEERSAHAYAARTRSELRAVLRDLPEYRRWRARARLRRMWRRFLPPWRRRRGA